VAECISKLHYVLKKAQIYAWNASECVLRPGSARTRWGSLSAPPGPRPQLGGAYFQGKGKGKEGNGKGRGGEAGKGKDDLHPTLFLGPGFTCVFFSIYDIDKVLLLTGDTLCFDNVLACQTKLKKCESFKTDGDADSTSKSPRCLAACN